MVGKARSSNFTLSEKLDLLKLVKPYVKILEEHTNKHSVIVEKNRCWDIIAVSYNAMGGDRPPRTAQGLRTLYKRLKEYAKQELLQQKETQSDFKSNISEPTKKVMEMIPQISSFCLVRDRNHIQSIHTIIRSKLLIQATTWMNQRHYVHSAPKEITVSKGQEEEPASLVKYFSVVWCKASKKKHKKWEGDAVLIVKGKSFTLKNLEGKDIGRGIVIFSDVYD
uniref:RAD54 homolog B n=1 Tax=Equus caballus TaxID=9796 RepID=A0A9L0TF87_HORSE